MVAMERPHLLILDEPTNHLDIDSRRALTEALNDYSGAVILITHDRSLMEMVADRLWLVSDGSVKAFDGDIDDYARFVLERARAANRNPTKGRATPQEPPPPVPTLPIAPLKRKLEAAEEALARETKLFAEIDAALADPAIYADPVKVVDVRKRHARMLERLAEAEAKWMAAAEVYESAKVNA